MPHILEPTTSQNPPLVPNNANRQSSIGLSAALVVDGAMLSIFAKSIGRKPDLAGLVRWAENKAGSPLADRQWYDANKDAVHNEFHITAALLGFTTHVNPVIKRSIKVDGSKKVQIPQQLGVDVALAIGTYESMISLQWDVLVLVAGDGDFYPLAQKVHASGRRIILLSEQPYTSSHLAPFVSKQYDLCDNSVANAVTRL